MKRWIAKLLALASVAMLAACANTSWRARQIDGSSAATFERSVAMMQNELPSRRRESLDVALVVIFMRAAALDAGDFDGDGDVDYFDARSASDTARNLLTEVQRGNLVSAAEESKGNAVAAAYFGQLDGLGYDGVVELAGDVDAGSYQGVLKRQRSQAACAHRWGARPPPLGNTSRITRCD